MSSGLNWKIILFAGLGLLGLALIGVGSWMLLMPDGQGFPGIQPDQPAPIETQFPTSIPDPTFSFITETQSSTLILQGSKTPEANLTEIIIPTTGPTPSPTAWQACPNAFLSHLRVGMKAKLSEDPPLPNRVRESANTTAKIVGMIQPGESVEVIDGPGCSNNWVWWKIRKSDGVTGWTAEGDGQAYWLLPQAP